MNRPYNFGAGPAMLPESVLEEAKNELLNWQQTGMSIMEIGHRTPEFIHLFDEVKQGLRDLLAIPNTHHVLFLGSAARAQFSMIPLNFLRDTEQAGYLVTGIWSSLAYQEASFLKKAYCVASGENNGFTAVPDEATWQYQKDTRYLYFTSNETIQGIRVANPPNVGDTPLVVDMTSSLLSEPIKVDDYALIFAGAQKNIANAGLTVVIIRDDFLRSMDNNPIPTMMDYRVHANEQSLYATPPTFNCYLALKMFNWVKKQGGVDALYAVNCQKASLLYNYIDTSSFYFCPIDKGSRSLVNVCFHLKKPVLEALFLEQASERGLLALKGHRAVGGLRASLYNAMPIEGVLHLVEFMCDFAKVYS